MELARVSSQGRQKIQKYGNGRFTVSGVVFTGSVLVLPDKTLLWPATDVANLSDDALAFLIQHAGGIDICLLGCGLKTVALLPALRQRLKDGGVKLDLMDTGAACRTYNVLAGEGRNIAAALVAI